MKKLQILIFSCLLLSVTPSLWASTKIAVFSPQEAILGSNTAKSRIKILMGSKSYKTKKNRFEALKKEGEALIEKVQKDSDVMSVNKKNEIRAQLKSKEKELTALAKQLKEKEMNVNQKLLQEMAPRLERAVKQVIKAQKVGLLIDRNAVMHAEPSFDVTKFVIKRLNQ